MGAKRRPAQVPRKSRRKTLGATAGPGLLHDERAMHTQQRGRRSVGSLVKQFLPNGYVKRPQIGRVAPARDCHNNLCQRIEAQPFDRKRLATHGVARTTLRVISWRGFVR